MKVSPSIFREYDVRGVAGKEFAPKAIAEYEKWYGPFPGINITMEIAEAIGRAYGTVIRRDSGREVAVGHEIRPFADELTDEFIKGIRRTGCNVTDLGICLTPVVYFMTAFSKFDGGVNVTGSHNIYFFNGFKLMRKNVSPIGGEDLQKLRVMVEQEDFIEEKIGEYKKHDGYPEYKKYYLKHIKIERPLKIVVDCGNGSAGPFAPGLLRELGCEVIDLYSNPDATFPNHIPDPEDSDTLKELSKQVVAHKADFGIGLDADADRVGFVDEKGIYIDTDMAFLLLAKDVLSRHPGKKVLCEVKCSRLVPYLIKKWGGVSLMHRTGHAPIKTTMRKDNDIVLAGEVSGHFFFVEDYFKIDDGLYGAGKILELFSKQNGTFSSIFKDFPKTVRTPEIKLPCADEKKFKIVKTVTDRLSKQYKSITIDGVRFSVTPTSWGLIRASNTSPYLTIRAEGDNLKELLKVKNIIADELELYPEITDRLNRKEISSRTGRLGWV